MKIHDQTEKFEISETEFNEHGLNTTQNMKFYNEVIMLIAEFVGTAMLVFFGCIGCIDWGDMTSFIAPLNFGLVVMFLTQIFGHFSFAIFNPSVAIAAFVCRIIDLKLGILYILVQLAGSVVGYGLLKVLINIDYINSSGSELHCVTQPHNSISVVQAVFIEFLLTSALILISCSHWDPKNRQNGDSLPLRMGLTVAALGITGGHLTGASMNPARTFGPAFWNSQWDNQWMYWFAPLSSGLITSIFYKNVFWDKNPKESIKT